MKTLEEKVKEVAEWCVAKGWSGPDSPAKNFDDCMALLHSEVSEALEAYRDYGLEDGTKTLGEHRMEGTLPKPEGVGSELADVLIRLADDIDRFKISPRSVETGSWAVRPVDPFPTFGTAMNRLHKKIAMINEHYMVAGFAVVLFTLESVAKFYGVDLEAEYERKMAYNWTRTFRHGGKRL